MEQIKFSNDQSILWKQKQNLGGIEERKQTFLQLYNKYVYVYIYIIIEQQTAAAAAAVAAAAAASRPAAPAAATTAAAAVFFHGFTLANTVHHAGNARENTAARK